VNIVQNLYAVMIAVIKLNKLCALSNLCINTLSKTLYFLSYGYYKGLKQQK